MMHHSHLIGWLLSPFHEFRRTIRMYLVDGTASGLITIEIMNWTGHAVLCPRSK